MRQAQVAPQVWTDRDKMACFPVVTEALRASRTAMELGSNPMGLHSLKEFWAMPDPVEDDGELAGFGQGDLGDGLG